MRIPLLLAAALLAFAQPVVAQGADDADPEKPAFQPRGQRPLRVGEKLAARTVLRTLDGRQVLFKELRERTVVFVFWSAKCPFSKRAEPKLVQLAKDYAAKGVLLVAVNSNVTEIGTSLVNGNGMPRKAVEASYKAKYPELVGHYKKNRLNFAVVIDTKNKLADVLGAQKTPEVFVFDKTGRLRYKGAIDDDPRNVKRAERTTYLRAALDAVLADKEPERVTTATEGCTIKRVGTGVAGAKR